MTRFAADGNTVLPSGMTRIGILAAELPKLIEQQESIADLFAANGRDQVARVRYALAEHLREELDHYNNPPMRNRMADIVVAVLAMGLVGVLVAVVLLSCLSVT